jgi:predicted RNA-binding protein YlxR (DUF448 family)
MKKRKIPLRMCLGCNEMKSKKELIRVVKNKEGKISVDFKGKKPGRGAYICNDISCFNKAKKAKRFEKALEQSIDEEIYSILEEELLKGE